jgi:hypothetical protein
MISTRASLWCESPLSTNRSSRNGSSGLRMRLNSVLAHALRLPVLHHHAVRHVAKREPYRSFICPGRRRPALSGKGNAINVPKPKKVRRKMLACNDHAATFSPLPARSERALFTIPAPGSRTGNCPPRAAPLFAYGWTIRAFHAPPQGVGEQLGQAPAKASFCCRRMAFSPAAPSNFRSPAARLKDRWETSIPGRHAPTAS